MNFIQTVETTAKTLWGDLKADAEKGAIELWTLAKPLFASVKLTVVSDLKTSIADILADIGAGDDLPTLEAAVMNRLELLDADLFAEAKALGSNLLQVIIGLAKAAL